MKEDGVKGATAQERMDKILSITDKVSVAQIGWPTGFNLFQLKLEELVLKILGWVLSIIAALFGAPFWFDLLKKTLNLRSAGQKPQEPSAAPANS